MTNQSIIPVVEELINKKFGKTVVYGTVSPIDGYVFYDGRNQKCLFMTQDAPIAGRKCAMIYVDNIWCVFGIEASPVRVPVQVFHNMNTITHGGVFVSALGAVSPYNIGWTQSGGAINNSGNQNLFLVAGDYRLRVNGATNLDKGISTWYFDDVLLGTMDWYSGGVVYNVDKELVLYVPYTGYHNLKYVVATKNGASSAYTLFMTHYMFLPV